VVLGVLWVDQVVTWEVQVVIWEVLWGDLEDLWEDQWGVLWVPWDLWDLHTRVLTNFTPLTNQWCSILKTRLRHRSIHVVFVIRRFMRMIRPSCANPAVISGFTACVPAWQKLHFTFSLRRSTQSGCAITVSVLRTYPW